MNEHITDATCATWVLKWATQEVNQARGASLKANIDEQCRQTAEKEWEAHNYDDGVGTFSGNPYKRSDYADRERVRLGEAVLRWDALLDFVSRRICECIEEPQGENQ